MNETTYLGFRCKCPRRERKKWFSFDWSTDGYGALQCDGQEFKLRMKDQYTSQSAHPEAVEAKKCQDDDKQAEEEDCQDR